MQPYSLDCTYLDCTYLQCEIQRKYSRYISGPTNLHKQLTSPEEKYDDLSTLISRGN